MTDNSKDDDAQNAPKKLTLPGRLTLAPLAPNTFTKPRLLGRANDSVTVEVKRSTHGRGLLGKGHPSSDEASEEHQFSRRLSLLKKAAAAEESRAQTIQAAEEAHSAAEPEELHAIATPKATPSENESAVEPPLEIE